MQVLGGLSGKKSSTDSRKQEAYAQLSDMATCAVPRHLAEDPPVPERMLQWLHAHQAQQSTVDAILEGLWGPVTLQASAASSETCVL